MGDFILFFFCFAKIEISSTIYMGKILEISLDKTIYLKIKTKFKEYRLLDFIT